MTVAGSTRCAPRTEIERMEPVTAGCEAGSGDGRLRLAATGG